MAQLVKNLPAMWETWVQSLGSEDPLEKGTATHSSILAWRIPWAVESMGSERVEHKCMTEQQLIKQSIEGMDLMIIKNISLKRKEHSQSHSMRPLSLSDTKTRQRHYNKENYKPIA